MRKRTEASRNFTLHLTYEKAVDGKRATTAYIATGDEVDRLVGAKFLAWTKSLKTGDALRLTSVRSTDPLLLDLAERGVRLRYCYWHDSGIAKDLPPEEIAAKFAELPDAIFREFKPRADIAYLRHCIASRNNLIRFCGNVVRATKQDCRNAGLADDDAIADDPVAVATLVGIEFIRKNIVSEDGTSLDTEIAKLAAAIPECQLVRKILCVDDWISAASIVAFTGGFERFPRVASLWHFCGQHVVDGTAPKRRKGAASDWSPSLRTALYLAGTAIIRNTKNPWRKFYDRELRLELKEHDAKHPNCATKQGHCGARARRKMVKEILKRIWLAANGRAYLKTQQGVGYENGESSQGSKGVNRSEVVCDVQSVGEENVDGTVGRVA